MLLAASGGDFTLPYTVFIGIDIVGAVLLMFVTKECKGTVLHTDTVQINAPAAE